MGFAMALSEACQNIVEHAGTSGWVAVQAYNFRRRLGRRVVVIAVSDAGVGFRRSLESTQAKRFGDRWGDAAALEAALIQNVSRFRDPGRGPGSRGHQALPLARGRARSPSAAARRASRSCRRGTTTCPLADHLPFFPGAQVQIVIPAPGRRAPMIQTIRSARLLRRRSPRPIATSSPAPPARPCAAGSRRSLAELGLRHRAARLLRRRAARLQLRRRDRRQAAAAGSRPGRPRRGAAGRAGGPARGDRARARPPRAWRWSRSSCADGTDAAADRLGDRRRARGVRRPPRPRRRRCRPASPHALGWTVERGRDGAASAARAPLVARATASIFRPCAIA